MRSSQAAGSVAAAGQRRQARAAGSGRRSAGSTRSSGWGCSWQLHQPTVIEQSLKKQQLWLLHGELRPRAARGLLRRRARAPLPAHPLPLPAGVLQRDFKHLAVDMFLTEEEGQKVLKVDCHFGKRKALASIRTCTSHVQVKRGRGAGAGRWGFHPGRGARLVQHQAGMAWHG